VKKKPSDVPVFLIYAGIIHAIGLALLLPMIVTLPGPGGTNAPDTSIVDVQIIPEPSAASNLAADDEPTAAIASGPGSSGKDQAAESGAAVANVAPEAEAGGEQEAPPSVERKEAEPAPAPAEEKPKADGTRPGKPALNTVKKPAASGVRTARPSVRSPAKSQLKIAPFNGALTGLFAPGAPASTRR
jgi:hypothetical protein